MRDWDRYASERDAAAYRGMGMLEALLGCGALPASQVDRAKDIVAAYDRANELMEKARLAENAAEADKAKDIS